MTLFFCLVTLFPHKLVAFAFAFVFVTYGVFFFFFHDCLIYCKDDLCRNVILVYCFVVPDAVAQGLQEARQHLLQLEFAVAMMAACSFFAHHTPSLPFQAEDAQVYALSFRLPSSHCSLTT